MGSLSTFLQNSKFFDQICPDKYKLSEAHSNLTEQEQKRSKKKAIRDKDGTTVFKKEKKSKDKKRHRNLEQLPDKEKEQQVKVQAAVSVEKKEKKQKKKKKSKKHFDDEVKKQETQGHSSPKKQKKHSKKKKKTKHLESQESEVKVQQVQQVKPTELTSQSEGIYQEEDELQAKLRKKAKRLLRQKPKRVSKSLDKKKEEQTLSLEDSDRIIQLFSQDGGDYRTLDKKMPHLGQTRIRSHLKKIFEWILEEICLRSKRSGRIMKQWQNYQKLDIIRQLHRIRSSNRLLSQTNAQFRQIFHKMMRSYNHTEVKLEDQQINILYLKIQSFVRGIIQLNFSRKNHFIAPDQIDETRRPLIEGGYIMESRAKRESRKLLDPNANILDPEKLVLEWSQQQQRVLSQLYIANTTNAQFIIQNLKTKYGDNKKWQDFQILGAKLDHLIILGLDKLQQLTSAPGNIYIKPKQYQEQDLKPITDLTGLIYSNRRACKTVREGGIVKNPSLLVRQVFGHTQSYKVKQRVVKLLINRYPEQQDVLDAICVIKEEDNNKVTLNRRRVPVLDDSNFSQSYHMLAASGKSQGVSMFQDDQYKVGMEDYTKKAEESRPVSWKAYEEEEEPASFDEYYGYQDKNDYDD